MRFGVAGMGERVHVYGASLIAEAWDRSLCGRELRPLSIESTMRATARLCQRCSQQVNGEPRPYRPRRRR